MRLKRYLIREVFVVSLLVWALTGVLSVVALAVVMVRPGVAFGRREGDVGAVRGGI